MRTSAAKHAARKWVAEEVAELPGFAGAIFTGSTNTLPGGAELPASSDVDVMVFLDGSDPPELAGKFIYEGVLLEASYTKSESFPTPESILGYYHMAGSFAVPGSVIADPTGHLEKLHTAVSSGFAERRWVGKRLGHAEGNARRFLRSLDDAEEIHDRATAWLFGTGVTTHMLLVAGLRNPTVRKRYAAARSLLERYGRIAFHEELLGLLGCARMRRARAERHLGNLVRVFDAAKNVVGTPHFFAPDISDAARPVAIGGSRELIEADRHREAIFWILATYARCRKILHADAPKKATRFDPGLHELLEDLGIKSSTDLRERAKLSEEFLPRVREVSEEIMVENSGIED